MKEMLIRLMQPGNAKSMPAESGGVREPETMRENSQMFLLFSLLRIATPAGRRS